MGRAVLEVRRDWEGGVSPADWAPSPYSVESMGVEMFRQARWLSVYGAWVALQAHQKMLEGRGAPDEHDFAGYVEEATTLANMAAEAVGDPER